MPYIANYVHVKAAAAAAAHATLYFQPHGASRERARIVAIVFALSGKTKEKNTGRQICIECTVSSTFSYNKLVQCN